MFWFLCSLCFARPSRESVQLKKGKKIHLSFTYGADVQGWVSRFSRQCIEISNSEGLRTFDVRTIASVKFDAQEYSASEMSALLTQDRDSSAPLPKESTIMILGALNAGVPFGFIRKKKDAVGLGLFDVVILGGGVYSLVQQSATSIPVFIGLAGLRIWSVNEVISRIRNEENRSRLKGCTLD